MGACGVLRYMEGALVLALPTLPCLSLKIGNVEIALFEKEILIFLLKSHINSLKKYVNTECSLNNKNNLFKKKKTQHPENLCKHSDILLCGRFHILLKTKLSPPSQHKFI